MSGSPYAITASGAVDSDYTISYVAGTLTVTPVALTITADNQTKVYGAALPALTASYTGFVNGDTSASLTTPAHACHDGHGSQPCRGSPYAITASGAVDADYTISYVAGTLTVTPVALTITANNQTKVYGAALPTLTASYTGFVNGDTSASLTTPAHADHHGHRHQPGLRQPLRHHRQRRGRYRLHDQLRRRHADRDARRA